MAATIKQISDFLTSRGLKFQVEQGREAIILGVGTDNYLNTRGDKGLLIVIELLENGEYLKVFAPNCYSYKDGDHKMAVFQCCLMISWLTKLIQFEYDVTDGEIRIIIEFPLEDAPLTEKQLRRCLSGIVSLVDKYDPMIRKAMQTGELQPPEDEADLYQQFLSFLAQRKAQGEGKGKDEPKGSGDLPE